jgi:hypothetical protein
MVSSEKTKTIESNKTNDPNKNTRIVALIKKLTVKIDDEDLVDSEDYEVGDGF